MAADSALEEANSGFTGQTLRQVARVSIGGRELRVRFPMLTVTGRSK
jgi:hypothetical protein